MKKDLSIKQYREILGLTQEYMGHRLNISQSNYCRIEKGENTHIDNLKMIAQILNVDLKFVIDNAIPVFLHIYNKDDIDANDIQIRKALEIINNQYEIISRIQQIEKRNNKI